MNYKAKNVVTGKEREVKVSLRYLQNVTFEGVDRCCGSCGCVVEPDGHCPKGWPSRSLVAGVL